MLDGRCGLLSETVELESEIVGDNYSRNTKGKACESLGADLVAGKDSWVGMGNPFLVRWQSGGSNSAHDPGEARGS